MNMTTSINNTVKVTFTVKANFPISEIGSNELQQLSASKQPTATGKHTGHCNAFLIIQFFYLFPLKSIFQSSYNHHLQSRYLSTYTCLAFFCLTLLKYNALKHWSTTLYLPACINAASDHICKLYIHYKSCTIFQAVRYTNYYFAMCCL